MSATETPAGLLLPRQRAAPACKPGWQALVLTVVDDADDMIAYVRSYIVDKLRARQWPQTLTATPFKVFVLLPLPLGEGGGEGSGRLIRTLRPDHRRCPHPNPLPEGEGERPKGWLLLPCVAARLGPQAGKVKAQSMLRHAKAQLAVGRVRGQQAALEQSRHLRRGKALTQPQQGLELAALQFGLRQ